jgi:pyridoxal phosphate enzyme (YggS family)
MIKENLEKIEEIIRVKCSQSGRRREEITLIAVSKTQLPETVRDTFDLGIEHFGENKAQELKQKYSEVDRYINWHFIGHLQTNKVKDVVPITSFIHSVDTIKLAAEINKRAGQSGKKQNLLLEVKTTEEDSKYGITDFDSLSRLADFCSKAENINLSGLMTMAPFTEDQNKIRKSFIMLRTFRDMLISNGYSVPELSMGMTNDFEIAIEEGATMLRIGTAIFNNLKEQ